MSPSCWNVAARPVGLGDERDRRFRSAAFSRCRRRFIISAEPAKRQELKLEAIRCHASQVADVKAFEARMHDRAATFGKDQAMPTLRVSTISLLLDRRRTTWRVFAIRLPGPPASGAKSEV